MAEFLILKKPHWLTADTKPSGMSLERYIEKYNSRQIPGDITSVHENGFYRIEALGEGLHGWNRNTWNLVRVKNLQLKDCVIAALPITKMVGEKVYMQAKFAFHIPNWESIPWKKNIVTISGIQVEECYFDFNNIQNMPFVKKVIP